MSYLKIKKLIENNKLDIGALYTGNPAFNNVIIAIKEKYKIGIFEGIPAFIRRTALEDEDTLELLWESNLIVFKNQNNGEEYRVNRLGNIDNLYEKINKIE